MSDPDRSAGQDFGRLPSIGRAWDAAMAFDVSCETPAVHVRQALSVLLAALPADQRTVVQRPWTDPGRTTWDSGPRERPCGMRLDTLVPTAQPLVEVVLSHVSSAHGQRCLWGIRSLESILGRLEGGRPHRDPGRYWVQVFGDPQQRAVSFRFEGHHLSVNATVVDEAMRLTPLFRATNPARVPDDDARAGWRVLAREEAAGHAWFAACTMAERQAALIAGDVPMDTLTRTAAFLAAGDIPDTGVAIDNLGDAARAAVLAALDVWLNHLPPAAAHEFRQRNDLHGGRGLRAAWMGGTGPGTPHYWRIASPRWVLEFAMGQNQGNHIHAVLREVAGDFARDLL